LEAASTHPRNAARSRSPSYLAPLTASATQPTYGRADEADEIRGCRPAQPHLPATTGTPQRAQRLATSSNAGTDRMQRSQSHTPRSPQPLQRGGDSRAWTKSGARAVMDAGAGTKRRPLHEGTAVNLVAGGGFEPPTFGL